MTVICGRDITFLWCLGGVFTADFSGARGADKAREWRDCVSRCAGAVSRGQDGASMSDGFTTARRAGGGAAPPFRGVSTVPGCATRPMTGETRAGQGHPPACEIWSFRVQRGHAQPGRAQMSRRVRCGMLYLLCIRGDRDARDGLSRARGNFPLSFSPNPLYTPPGLTP